MGASALPYPYNGSDQSGRAGGCGVADSACEFIPVLLPVKAMGRSFEIAAQSTELELRGSGVGPHPRGDSNASRKRHKRAPKLNGVILSWGCYSIEPSASHTGSCENRLYATVCVDVAGRSWLAVA